MTTLSRSHRHRDASTIRRAFRSVVVPLVVTACLVANGGPAFAAVTHRTKVTITSGINRTQALTDQAAVVSGYVSRHQTGERVTIQQLRRNTWTKIQTAPIKRNGAYRTTVRMNTPGYQRLRVATPHTKTYLAAHSPTLHLTIRQWHYLANMSPTVRKAACADSDSINGKFYAHSIDWNVVYSGGCYFGASSDYTTVASYNLRRGCAELRGVAGLDDGSPSDAQVDLAIDKDGDALWDNNMVFGTAYPVNLSMQGALRLNFTLKLVEYGTGNRSTLFPAIGNAQVLCTF